VSTFLLDDACTFFDILGVNVVNYWAPRDHFMVKLLSIFGFIDSRSEILVYFGNNGDPKILKMIRKIGKEDVLFQIGDTDWI
jgi:hypothetical protein